MIQYVVQKENSMGSLKRHLLTNYYTTSYNQKWNNAVCQHIFKKEKKCNSIKVQNSDKKKNSEFAWTKFLKAISVRELCPGRELL